MKISETDFFRAQETLQNIPFTQAKGWHDFSADDQEKAYYIDNKEKPTLAIWGRIFKIPLIGKILQIQGEAFTNSSPAAAEDLYREITQDGYAMILLSSVRDPAPELEYAIRKAGFVRPYGYTLCPLSVVVDTQKSELRHRSWKKNVKRAIAQNLVFSKVKHPDLKNCETFSKIFTEMAIAKKIKHRIDAQKLLNIFQDPSFELFFVSQNNQILSGEIIYIQKNAEGVLAANSLSGRNCGSSYYLREKIFEYLAKRDIIFFDFSRIAPGLNSADSLCEFKLSSGGKIVQYFGEWVWAKNPYIELLYLIYRQFLKHGARY